MEIVHLLRIK